MNVVCDLHQSQIWIITGLSEMTELQDLVAILYCIIMLQAPTAIAVQQNPEFMQMLLLIYGLTNVC